MIKYECDNGQCSFEAKGGFAEITADILLLIKMTYNEFEDAGDDAGEVFKNGIKMSIMTDLPFLAIPEDLKNVESE